MDNTSCFGTSVLETDKPSLAYVDWSNFSFERELNFIYEHSNSILQRFSEFPQICQEGSSSKDTQNGYANFLRYLEAEIENYDIINQLNDLSALKKDLEEKCKKLTSDFDQFEHIKTSFEEELGKLESEQKLQKFAYKKALTIYKKNFDFNVNVIDNSDLIEANITFHFAEHMDPINVLVDRNQRKIIEIFSKPLRSGNSQEANFDGNFLCGLRKYILDNVL